MGSPTTILSSRPARSRRAPSSPSRKRSDRAPSTSRVPARGCSLSSAAISAGSAFRTSRRSSATLSPPSPAPRPSPLAAPPARGSLTRSTASAVARHDLLDVLAEDRAGGHQQPVGDRRRGGRPPVDRAVDQDLLGAELDHRVAHGAHVGGRARAGHFDGARPRAAWPARLRRAASSRPSARRRSCATPLARSSSPVVATRLPSARFRRGFSMRASITSCASPSRPIEVTPTRRRRGRMLGEDRRERLGLAGVLGEPHQREPARSATAAPSAARARR